MSIHKNRSLTVERLQQTRSPTSDAPTTALASERLDDLAQVIRAYNEVTQRLQTSHESLKAQVIRLQQELASTNAKLQRSKRLTALGEMAAGIAHEIRNPLAAIQLYAGMLLDASEIVSSVGTGFSDGLNQAAVADTAKKIAAAVRGLDAIVNDVLIFARDLSPNTVLMTVPDLFDRALDTCQPLIVQAQVHIDRLDQPNEDTTEDQRYIYADPELMHQAIVNLIRNALDAMSQPNNGSKQGHQEMSQLTLATKQEGGQTVLIIRDTGPGIEDHDVDRIFNPFFTTRNTGTGLGLAIVHRIIDAHSGTISVHNNHGAVFELSLPSPLDTSQRSRKNHLCNQMATC